MALRTRDPGARASSQPSSTPSPIATSSPAFMTEPRLTRQQMQTIFRQVFARHLDKLEAVVAREKQEFGFRSGRSERSGRVMGWVFRLLELRGPKIAAIDASAVAAMRADNMSDAEISEVGAMLGLVTRRGDRADPIARIEAIVRDAGGEPTPINIAPRRQTIAEANFESARRHDGGARKPRRSSQASSESGSKRPASERNLRILEIEAPPTCRGDHFAASRQRACGRASADNRTNDPRLYVPPRLDDHPDHCSWREADRQELQRRVGREDPATGPCDLSAVGATAARGSGFRHRLYLDRAISPWRWRTCSAQWRRPTARARMIAIAASPSCARSERRSRGGRTWRPAGNAEFRHLTFLGQLLAFIRGQGLILYAGVDLSLLRGKTRDAADTNARSWTAAN